MNKTFLTAEWRKLAIANFKVPPQILKKYLPFKTELDLWNEVCYVSLAGFMFLNVKVKGIKIPFHTDFEEVNLRFYVKHKDEIANEWKRGVVFIKEIVPKPLIAFIANTIYKENYEAMEMKHEWKIIDDSLEIKYEWKFDNKWHSFKVNNEIENTEISKDSEEEFITEHYFGYTKINDSSTSEYRVERPKWRVYKVKDYKIDVDFEKIYGSDFAFLNNENPSSVFLAEGSKITIMNKVEI